MPPSRRSPLETAEAALAAYNARPAVPGSAYDTRWLEWAVELAEFVKATVHRPEELRGALGLPEPCKASTYLEGYGMAHCDQPKGHDGNHAAPLYTEHSWKQEKAG